LGFLIGGHVFVVVVVHVEFRAILVLCLIFRLTAVRYVYLNEVEDHRHRRFHAHHRKQRQFCQGVPLLPLLEGNDVSEQFLEVVFLEEFLDQVHGEVRVGAVDCVDHDVGCVLDHAVALLVFDAGLNVLAHEHAFLVLLLRFSLLEEGLLAGVEALDGVLLGVF